MDRSAAFEIKSGSLNLPILRLLSSDVLAIGAQFAERVAQAPDFFRNAPVILDANGLGENMDSLNFHQLVAQLRAYGAVPVGIRGLSGELGERAVDAGLIPLAESRNDSGSSGNVAVKKPADKSPHAPETPAARSGKVVTDPVRSGQRVYAPGGDLVVLAPVSAGAEVMADGHIHVYSVLRGRALAGVRGDLGCRIFCMDLQAELISIAGQYQVSENLSESDRGKPIQVYYRDGSLIIDELR